MAWQVGLILWDVLMAQEALTQEVLILLTWRSWDLLRL